MLQTMHQKGQKGFTLVELMIVVAIIGILAAIAIPQFAQYRIRGFNASAQSDIRNLTTAQEAFFADWQRYAVTFDAGAGGNTNVLTGPDPTATGAILTGPSTVSTVLAQFAQAGHRQLGTSIGNMVSVAAQTDANAVSYTAIGKHLQGNTMYGADSDSSAMYRDQTTLDPGATFVIATHLPASTTPTDDFAAITTWAAQ